MVINEVAAPQNLLDALSFYKRFPNVVPALGCTSLIHKDSKEPISILSLHNIKELQTISKTDRYIEFGSAITLMQFSSYITKTHFSFFKDILNTIGTYSTRTLATIGGNLFSYTSGTLFPVFTLLDASCEIRSLNSSKTVRFHEFLNDEGTPVLPQHFIITKIKIPIDAQWSIIFSKRRSVLSHPDECNPLLLIALDLNNTVCTNIRILFHDRRILRARALELFLIGKELPLNKIEIQNSLEILKSFLLNSNYSKFNTLFFIEQYINFFMYNTDDYL